MVGTKVGRIADIGSGSLRRPGLWQSGPNLWAWAMAALAVRRQRHHLAQADEAMLRDLGLTREAATREAMRPLWDVPSHWLR